MFIFLRNVKEYKKSDQMVVMVGRNSDHFYISKWSNSPLHLTIIITIAKFLSSILNLLLAVFIAYFVVLYISRLA